MVCGIWYENGIHIVLAYVLHASRSGCLQHSASIPCFNTTKHLACYTHLILALPVTDILSFETLAIYLWMDDIFNQNGHSD